MDSNILNEDLLELEGIEEKRKEWDTYSNDGNGVPRVTHILRQCEDSEGLIRWAASMGYKRYNYYKEKACDIGTIVHELLDGYLIHDYCSSGVAPFEVDYNEIPNDYRSSVYNCFENFKLWEKNLANYGASIEEVVGLEIPVTCPWFGGTIDGIVKINGAYYIIDFKTSKQISPSYLLQTSAYMWVINNGYTPQLPHIDGIGIIRVDKSGYGIINDLFLNDFNPDQHNMIINFQNCFMSYVDTYYRNASVGYIFDRYKKLYNPKSVYGENYGENK